MGSIVATLVWFPLAPRTSAHSIPKGRPSSDLQLLWPTAPATEAAATVVLMETLRGPFPPKLI